jgi:hypothetical protein
MVRFLSIICSILSPLRPGSEWCLYLKSYGFGDYLSEILGNVAVFLTGLRFKKVILTTGMIFRFGCYYNVWQMFQPSICSSLLA